MSFQGTGPGKTAPKLLQDLLESDPTKSHVPIHDPAPIYEGGPGRSIAPKGVCKHDYTTKLGQSKLPPLDLRPDGSTVHKVAAVCKRCRLHLEVRVDYSQATDPCPNSTHPLHHFQPVPGLDTRSVKELAYGWKCSATGCQALLSISFKPLRFTEANRLMIMDEAKLKARYQYLMETDPAREGMRPATPMDALYRLRRYIKDALKPENQRRTFAAHNKRFQEAFGEQGQDCAELLDGLGFKYADEQWTLPNPGPTTDSLQPDAYRAMLEDVELELFALMMSYAAETGAMNPDGSESWWSANKDIERTLATQGYPRAVALTRNSVPSEKQPYFASLGALPDFADSLVGFAHDRQSACDPEQQAYYFECLKEIASDRSSDLQTKVAVLESEGRISRRDVREAYRFFNISIAESRTLSDQLLLGRCQSRMQDMSSTAAEEGRIMLGRIGSARGSMAIINASKQTLETYEDALTWLGNGANKATSDEFLISLYGMKVSDDNGNSEKGRKALSIIARERKSEYINNWLATGETTTSTMDIDDACRYLNIEKLADIDKAMLHMLFDSARSDRPGVNTDKAIAAVEKAVQGTVDAESHAPEIWPVGLTSHGNTCYLNSLLQYYFSIKPLRSIVLDYNHYKLDTLSQAEKVERVGNRKITHVEIQGGQKFADDLGHLFDRMIKDSGTTVKPELDLVCRAFLDPKDSDLQEDEAQPNNDESKQAEADAADGVNGTHEADKDSVMDTSDAPSDISAASSRTLQSSASSVTLQDDIDAAQHPTGVLTPPASDPPSPVGSKPEPTRAPPLPPRLITSAPEKKQSPLEKAQENARNQQDVTEVHDGIMFRLRAGIKPTGMDAMEEQQDPLRDIFSMSIAETTVSNGQHSKPKQLPDSSIQLNVPYEDTDIYSALDAVFDLQPVNEDTSVEQYKSLKTLPPLLQINIPRIGYINNKAEKLNSCVRLEDELFLDRYQDESSSDTLERRKACWGWRKELQALQKEKKTMGSTAMDVDGPTAVAETAKYLESLKELDEELESAKLEPLDMNDELFDDLNDAAEQQAKRLAAVQGNIESLQLKLEQQFVDLKNLKYRPHAVFFHRGNYGHGHYWIYIHDFANDIWRNYNDEKVDEFKTLNDIFEARTWQQGTPTYAVYVRDDLKQEYVQPVCRAPERLPTPEPSQIPQLEFPDVQMQDAEAQQKGVDPKMVMEGGDATWDDERQVPDGATW